MKTIVLVNQKGGVGKTTFADEIAWGLERRGREVGFINLDPQGGASHEQKTVEGEKAVTVVDTSCMAADAWSTALTVLGVEQGLALAERRGLAARFLARRADGTLLDTASSRFTAMLEEGDPA